MVVGEYFDRGRRVDPEQRPELSRLLAELRERPVAYVVTFDSARIAQNVHHFACVAWRLGKSGTRLEIASEPHREVGEEARSLISYIGSVQLIDPESNGSDR
jgi:DNA invertase Pin-like site-specific DNA recombinase